MSLLVALKLAGRFLEAMLGGCAGVGEGRGVRREKFAKFAAVEIVPVG